jgi:hypothetical protein
MRGRTAWWGVAAITVACAASPRAEALRSPPEASGEVLVAIEFEPALLAPARLQVVHESGLRREVATQCTGVVLSLPPGPAWLLLSGADTVEELPIEVRTGMPVLLWRRASPLR